MHAVNREGIYLCILEKDVLGDLLGQCLQRPMTSFHCLTNIADLFPWNPTPEKLPGPA